MNCPHCGEYIKDEKPGLLERLWNAPVFMYRTVTWEKGELPPGARIINQNILIIDKDKIKDQKLLRKLEELQED